LNTKKETKFKLDNIKTATATRRLYGYHICYAKFFFDKEYSHGFAKRLALEVLQKD
jgi:hypothetical protein